MKQAQKKKYPGMVYDVPHARPKRPGVYELRYTLHGTTYSELWTEPKITVRNAKKLTKSKIRNLLQLAAADFICRCKDGKVKTKAQRKAEAEAEAAARAEHERQINTFAEYAEKVYFPMLEAVCERDNTIIAKKSAYQCHLLPRFGEMKLQEITAAHVQSFIADSLKEYSVMSVKLWRAVLSGIFRDAIEKGAVMKNPCEKVSIPKISVNAVSMEEEHKWFTSDEMEYIWTCAKNEKPRLQLELELMYWTGCRKGELVAMRWKDIDWKKRQITIAHSATYVAGKGVTIGPTKSGAARTVAIPDSTANMLKEFRRTQAESGIREFVFASNKNIDSPIIPQRVYDDLKRFGQKYGIDIHPHKLRHTYGSQAVQNGAAITDVSTALGHKSLSTTMDYYLHSDVSASRRVSEILQKNSVRAERTTG